MFINSFKFFYPGYGNIPYSKPIEPFSTPIIKSFLFKSMRGKYASLFKKKGDLTYDLFIILETYQRTRVTIDPLAKKKTFTTHIYSIKKMTNQTGILDNNGF